MANRLASAAVGIALYLSVPLTLVLLVVDLAIRPLATARVLRALEREGLPSWPTLYRSWFARVAGEVLRVGCRTGFERAVRERVAVRNDPMDTAGPKILALYHTPWALTLHRLLAEHPQVVALLGTRWAGRLSGVETTANARRAISHLAGGGSVVLMMDAFDPRTGRSYESRLFGKQIRVGTLAARLAGIAAVPIVPVSVRLLQRRLVVEVHTGSEICRSDVSMATEELLRAFERSVRQDPSSWRHLHRFLRRPDSP